MSTQATAVPAESSRALDWLKQQYALGILVVIVVLAAFLTDAFLSVGNLTNLVKQVSITGIVVLAQLMVVVTGGIDISVGSVLGLSAVLAAGVGDGSSALVGIAVGMAVGAALGAVNGTLVAYRNLEPFIVTLGMLALARGLVYAYTEGVPVQPKGAGFSIPGVATVAGFPVLGIFWLVCIVAVAFLLYRTVYGRRLYAVGSNKRAAFGSGIPVKRTLLVVYTLSGLLAGLGGFLLSSRLGSGTPQAGINYELDAIAAGLEAGGVTADVVASAPGEYSKDKAVPATENMLSAHPDITVFLGLNDAMALGALDVARQAGRTDVMVAGVDGQKEALKEIKDGGCTGQYVATGLNSPSLATDKVMEIAEAVTTGKKKTTDFEKLSLTKAVGIGCDTIDEYYEPGSVF